MKTPSSVRQLFRAITSAAGATPAFLLLRPSPVGPPFLWTGPHQEQAPLPSQSAVAMALTQVPPGSRTASPTAPWVQGLAGAIFGAHRPENQLQVMAISSGPQVIACLGWSKPWPAYTAKVWTEKVPQVQRIVRDALNFEKIRTVNDGLRWVLERSDRAVASARADGQILDTSLAARDLLKAMKFGGRHHARSDAPEFPPSLIRAFAPGLSRQVKLSGQVTARFEPANDADSWLPVLGIEFFVEPKSTVPLHVPGLSNLTAAERDVLEKILARKTNEQIACERGTKFATAKNQVSALLGKLGITSRRDLFVPGLSAPSMDVLGNSMAIVP
jgi:DNA-binding NarL/FixJ family response regulator